MVIKENLIERQYMMTKYICSIDGKIFEAFEKPKECPYCMSNYIDLYVEEKKDIYHYRCSKCNKFSRYSKEAKKCWKCEGLLEEIKNVVTYWSRTESMGDGTACVRYYKTEELAELSYNLDDEGFAESCVSPLSIAVKNGKPYLLEDILDAKDILEEAEDMIDLDNCDNCDKKTIERLKELGG